MRSFSEAVLDEVDGDRAIVDKIDIQVDLCHLIFDTTDSIEGLRGRVTRNSEEYRNEINDDRFFIASGERHCPRLSDSNYDRNGGWIFNRVSSSRIYDPFRVSSKGWEDQCPRPLFAGKMNLRARVDEHLNFEFYLVNLDFHLNFCQFLHFNNPTTRQEEAFQVGVHREDEARTSESSDGEFSLDGKDNWIRNRGYSYLRWHQVKRILGIYITRVKEAVTQELVRATRFASIEEAKQNRFLRDCNNAQKYKLEYCEIAWEFQDEHPVRRIDELLPVFRLYSQDRVEVNEYRVTNVYEGYARSVIARLGNGNQLAVYAKTNRRLRFEVRYRMNRGCAPSPLSAKTARTQSEMIALVDELKIDAVAKMNTLFSLIRSRSAPALPHSVTPLDLILITIGHCRQNREVAEMILNQLSTRGSVPPANKIKKNLYDSIQRMKNNMPPVLEFRREIHAYVPKREFEWAVSRLSELGGLSHLISTPSSVARSEREDREGLSGE